MEHLVILGLEFFLHIGTVHTYSSARKPWFMTYDSSSELIYLLFNYFSQQYIGVLNKQRKKSMVHWNGNSRWTRMYEIAVDPNEGYLFASRLQGIYRYEMDGSGEQLRMHSSTSPFYGFAIDRAAKRLFYVDISNLYSVDYDGNRIMHQTLRQHEYFINLASSDKLYVLYHLESGAYLKWRNKTSTPWALVDVKTFINPKQLIAFRSNYNIPDNTVCSVNRGNCSDFCLRTRRGRRCSCQFGYHLLSDGLTCNNSLCEKKPCSNGATCSDHDGTFHCTCTKGYSGRQCLTDVNECQSNPCQNGAMCNDLPNQYTCTCPEGFTGINCQKVCRYPAEPLQPTFGHCRPLLLEGTVAAGCEQCETHDNITYQWTLRKLTCSQTDLALRDGNQSQTEFLCSTPYCSNILHGETEAKASLMLTVSAIRSIDSEIIRSSIITDVWVRQLPIIEDDLQCVVFPETGGKTLKTMFYLNCTALHVKYELYDNSDAAFYDNNQLKLMKKVYITITTKAILIAEFVGPVSPGFILPAGDDIILKSSVHNCNNLVLSQENHLKVESIDLNTMSLEEFRIIIENGNLMTLLSAARALRVKMADSFMDSKIKEMIMNRIDHINLASIDSIYMSTSIMNVLTEDVQWLQKISMKASVVDHYGSIEESFGQSIEHMSITVAELIQITGHLAVGITDMMDFFVDEYAEYSSHEEEKSIQMNVMTKKMMVALDGLCNTALKNLPQSGTQTVLFNSTLTTMLVQKVNSSTIAGSKLSIPSQDPATQDSWFEFPENMVFNNSEGIGIQMIYQKRNPHIWTSNLNVTAPVMSVEIKDDKGSKIDMKELQDPIKYVTPGPPEQRHDIGAIHLFFTKINDSITIQNSSQMLFLIFTMKPFETRIIDIILPNKISNVLVYAQDETIPTYETILEKGFIYPADLAVMQAFYGISTDKPSDNETSGFKLNIQTNETLLNGRPFYNMYLGITLNLNNKTMLEEVRDLDASCFNVTDTEQECSAVLSFSLRLSSLFCLYWEEVTTEWSSKGCQVRPHPESTQIECVCSHL